MRRLRLLPLAAVPLLVALVAAPTGSGSLATSAPAGPPVPGITDAGLRALLNPAAEPGDAMLARRGGAIPTGAFAAASAQSDALAAKTRKTDPKLAAAKWQLKGPTNVGGRGLDIVVDPKKVDSVYLAAASGGVWHSKDAGMRWRSVWPDSFNQAIGALAISKKGVLWAGTGEAGPGGGSSTYGGDGVYRSADGGKTWKNMGLRGSERIGRVVVDPRNENTVWVAANGPLFTPGGERGLFRTTNGGKSWQKVLAGENATTGAVDIALDPKDPKVIYTTMWDRIRYPDRRQYTGMGSGAFKSSDGGKTWARIGLPYFAPNPELGRLGIAVAPSDNKRVYILATTEAGLTAGLSRSSDGGATFTPAVDVPLVTGGLVYAWWFGRVYVDPKDANHVFATGVNMSESKDGGIRFSSVSGLHADQHGMAWDLRIPGRVYVVNDGGAYRSDNNGASFTHGEYMPWNQPFSIDVAEADPRKIVVGLQDNGGNRNYKQSEDPSDNGYHDITGGDGTEMAIDPKDNKYLYACSQYGSCARSSNGGGGMTSFDHLVVGSRKNWLTPIEFDPGRKGAVYTASEIVSESTDNGASWRPISPDLSGGPGRETNPLFINYGTVTTLSVAKAEKNTIYAGTDDGRVQYTHDGGTTWTRATGLPTDWVTSVAIDRRDPGATAFASFSGFRSGKSKAQIFRTTDGGKTWTDVSGDLPPGPVNDVVPVGDDLFAATDVGVFVTRGVSKSLGRSWLKVGTNLPKAPVTEIRWHAPSSTLFAGNFGRGAYSVKLGKGGKSPSGSSTGKSLSALAPAAAPAVAPAAFPAAKAAPAAAQAESIRAVPAASSSTPPTWSLAALALVAGLVLLALRPAPARARRRRTPEAMPGELNEGCAADLPERR
ncbi:MAG TPA: hypothetical protein VNA30_02410 [Mycobacteriales bacterium]|nr:hypothetical protein [Mycobacteriales bacterium]